MLKRSRMGALLYMTRPWNGFRVHVPAVLLGVLASLHATGVGPSTLLPALQTHLPAILWSLLAVITLSGAGYVINDYFDRDIDLINEPDRPLPSGVVSARQAVLLASTLFAVGLASGLQIGLANAGVAAIWAVFAVWYAADLKRSGRGAQSLAFGAIVGLTAIFGGTAVQKGMPSLPVILIAVFITLYITALHMTGTLKDIEGDRAGNCKTAAITLGEDTVRFLIPATYLISLGVFLYVAWASLGIGVTLSVIAVMASLAVLGLNGWALASRDRALVAKSHGASKTLLNALILTLCVHLAFRG